jgi:hypothetical protein
MNEILIQILENQKRISLALRRQIPSGENVDTPDLLQIEKECDELIRKI